MNSFADDDNLSVCSSGSTRSISDGAEKATCPVCKQPFQNKRLFNHIFTKHEDEFLEHTEVKWLQDVIDKDRAIKLCWSNDTETELELFGCLSSKKCFLTLERATRHFNKNTEDLKKHKAEAKKILKKLQNVKKRVKYSEVKNVAEHNTMFDNFRKENEKDFVMRHYRLALYLRNIYNELLPDFDEKVKDYQDHYSMYYGSFYSTLHKKNIMAFCKKASSNLDELIANKETVFISINRVVNCYQACLEAMYSLLKTTDSLHDKKQVFFMEIDDACMPTCPF